MTDKQEMNEKKVTQSEGLNEQEPQEEVLKGETEQVEEEPKPKKVPLLDRLVKRIYEEEGVKKEEYKKVRELISDDVKEGDVWETRDGKIVISHTGIRKLADYVGAEWIEERLDDTPNSNNDRGFYFHMVCLFPDGTKGKEVGSANDKNTKSDISNSAKYEMAYKRAQDRSFLNSSYMKMYDIYSADEADMWSKEDMLLHQLEQKNKQINHLIENGKSQIKKLENEIVRRNRFIDALLEYVALPETDEKYPSTYINSIIDKEDFEYVQMLLENKEYDKNIRFVAKRLMELRKITLEEKQQEDEQLSSEETPNKPVAEAEEQLEQTKTKKSASDSSESMGEGVQEEPASSTETQPLKEIMDSVSETGIKTVVDENEPKQEKPDVPSHTEKVKPKSKPFTMTPIEQEDDDLIRVNFRLGEDDEK